MTGYKLPLTFNYSFNHAEFKNNFDSDFAEWGDVSKGDFGLPYIPEHQYYLALTLEKPKFSFKYCSKI